MAAQGQPAAEGSLHGELVEISGIESAVEACDSRLQLLGAVVDPNGKCGYAHWSAERGRYAIQTLDGLFLEVPEAHLTVLDKLEPEDGGFDLAWPALPGASEAFAFMVAESLQAKGFCLIQMFETEMMRRSLLQNALRRDDFTLPMQEFEEAYLGRSPNSKVAWLGGDNPDEAGQDPLLRYEQYVMALVRVLLPVVGSYLGFKPHDYVTGSMLRMPLMYAGEREELSPGPVTQEAIDGGAVQHHLDFLQRRKLCVMYLVDNEGGTLELHLREDFGERTVRIPISKDKLLVFRCDVLSYSYKPRGSSRDMVLQTWIMDEPPALKIDNFIGDTKGMEAIIGGSHLPSDKQVHMMGVHSKYPGCGTGVESAHLVWTMQTDTFLEIPTGRFDMEAYYVADADQFQSGGKSVTKHIGCLEDMLWINFDNAFFGMSQGVAQIIPPCQRVCMESCTEILHHVGYRTLESLRGNRHLMVITCDIGTDWEGWLGYNPGPLQNTDEWLKAGQLNNSITSSNRLSYTLGLEGPSMQIDTACSASMVGCCMGHAQIRKPNAGASEVLINGFQNILTPWPFIGLSGAGMVGRTGRCLFFDQSGNGFARGEGWGGMFLKAGNSAQLVQDRLCVCASSYVNQDGRSASLTAPNGPSQQAVVRGSLANVNIHPDEIVCTENHGTGTALGDPIEAGTVKAVFGRKRQTGPIPVTSGKSHMGHLEPGAGSVGIIKTLVSLVHAAVPANVHLRHLNAHIEVGGFPALFPVERVDLDAEYHFGGANGFGFGGTNARIDLWGRRLHRVRDGLPARQLIGHTSTHRNVVHQVLPKQMDKLQGVLVTCARCMGQMCWLCGWKSSTGTQRHQCSAVREEFASYDICSNCYDGGYVLGSAAAAEDANAEMPSLPHTQDFFLTGTWSAWSTFEPMTLGMGPADADVYEGEITLGETRMEQFQVVMERHRVRSFFHPVVGKAASSVHITGPETDEPSRDLCWQIDGRRDGALPGTVYRVRFAWGDTQKWITWEATNKKRAMDDLWEEEFQHTYCIVSSLSEWRPIDLKQNDEQLDLWEVACRIPQKGEAEFYIQRDYDPQQTLYPLKGRPKESSVPVVGPDGGGSGKRWAIWGEPGEIVIFRLCISEVGEFSVTVICDTMGNITWRSPPGCGGAVYDLATPLLDWKFGKASELVADDGNPDIRRCRFKMSGRCKEEFQIVLNQNWDRRLYPEIDGDPPGSGLICGPDGKGSNRCWQVVGIPGQVFEVVLNLGAEDTRRLVSCLPLDGNWGDGRTEWTDEEWEQWEAEWSAYGEAMASGQYSETPWPPGGQWPGSEKRQLQGSPSAPPVAMPRQKDPLADGLNPWTEERIDE